MVQTIDIRFIIYALISQLANKSQTVMDHAFQEITSKQWLPLIMINQFDHNPTLKEISNICGITHQSAKQLLDQLVMKGFATVRRDELDKRCLRYSLTQKGQDWRKENLYKNLAFMQELFSDISQEEILTFFNIGKKLLTKLDTFKDDPDYLLTKLRPKEKSHQMVQNTH